MRAIKILLIICFTIYFSCSKKENPEGDPSQELVFESLNSEKDTVIPGESTLITAIAKGYMINYFWSASAGTILGSGSSVTYTTTPCQAGTNEVVCEIKDGNNNSESKTIYIVVQ